MDEVDPARDTQNQQRLAARAIKRTEVPQDVVGGGVIGGGTIGGGTIVRRGRGGASAPRVAEPDALDQLIAAAAAAADDDGDDDDEEAQR
jgi:hypothetical protein